MCSKWTFYFYVHTRYTCRDILYRLEHSSPSSLTPSLSLFFSQIAFSQPNSIMDLVQFFVTFFRWVSVVLRGSSLDRTIIWTQWVAAASGNPLNPQHLPSSSRQRFRVAPHWDLRASGRPELLHYSENISLRCSKNFKWSVGNKEG